MKTTLTLLIFLLITTTDSFGRIVHTKDKLFMEQNGDRIPMDSVNNLIREKKISKIRLYGNGEVHLLSFARQNGEEKLYSVDNKGFIYALDPFTNYHVKDIYEDGRVSFKEVPDKKYRISPKGFFFY